MLVENNPHPLAFYPTMLLQYSTYGPFQNLAPFSETVDIFNEDMTVRKTPIFRFYFDGLVSWMIRNAADQRFIDTYRNITVGYGLTLSVATMIYEGSFQQINGTRGIADTIAQYPDDMRKMLRLPPIARS